MRVLVLLISFCCAGQAVALGSSLYPDLMEFDEAMAVYQAGEFDRARRAFTHLAELGDLEARFNLGVMLFKGEGGDPDPITGTAWIQWAAESGVASAQEVLPIVTGRLDEDGRVAAEAVLASIRHANLPQLATWPEDNDDAHARCVAENADRPPPVYSGRTVEDQRIGFNTLHLLVGPEGNFDAVHAMPEGRQHGPFAGLSQMAARRWTAHDCSAKRYRHFVQRIIFTVVDFDGSAALTVEQRHWLKRILAEARAGGAEQAYIVGMLATLDQGLLAIDKDLVDRLFHFAAVSGFPDARYEFAFALPSGDHRDRWLVLAARQGYAPALFQLRHWDELPREERHEALSRAAEAGFLPAVFLAVRHLAAHPDAAERDGARALQLSSALPRGILRGDPSMAEVHAMALAESGRFDEAVSWQKRALSTGHRLGRNTSGAAARLALYEAGEPWRDPLLSSSPDAEQDD